MVSNWWWTGIPDTRGLDPSWISRVLWVERISNSSPKGGGDLARSQGGSARDVTCEPLVKNLELPFLTKTAETSWRFPTKVRGENASPPLKWCWWFRNPANSPVEVGSLSHYLQGFSTIPDFLGFVTKCKGLANHWTFFGIKRGLSSW